MNKNERILFNSVDVGKSLSATIDLLTNKIIEM
jgi:hypothetical protein